jgi:hypothetical protein
MKLHGFTPIIKSVFLKSTATAKTFPEAGLRAKNAVPGR